jgi:hypothetical protein
VAQASERPSEALSVKHQSCPGQDTTATAIRAKATSIFFGTGRTSSSYLKNGFDSRSS